MTDEDLHIQVDRLLAERGLIIADGPVGWRTKIGRRYKQKIVEAQLEDLAAAIVGVIAANAQAGDTVHWRIRPERHETRAYICYLVAGPDGRTRR